MDELNNRIDPISDVWLGDCMEYMKQFPDGFFDWGIVDPPYGIGCEIGSSGYTKKRFQHRKSDNWDKCVPDQSYFNELMRVTRSQIIWGGNYYNLPPSKNWAIWFKSKACQGCDFSECEMAWITPSLTKSKMSGIRLYEYNPTAPSKVLRKIHPTQKPIPLYRWLINKYTQKGDKILDTHMGSQSSRIAAYRLERNYWGCEIDPGYFEDGCELFKREISQLQLFKY